MTSDTQSSEFLEPKPPAVEAPISYFSEWIATPPYARPDKPVVGRDHGLWLVRTRNVHENSWLRLKQQYAESARMDQRDRALYDSSKRFMDICGALVLLVALTPFFLIVALLIRMDSPGPALFRQFRVGFKGRRFMIWKFRTMHTSARCYARSPRHPDDRRVTRLGRFLRRTSIDELPQLINVLRGEMSLIGPRPEMPFIAARYTRIERQRLAVRPGMTGLWQISPARSAPIHHNLHCDLHYIRHRNLLLDAAILLRTVLVVVSGNGPH